MTRARPCRAGVAALLAAAACTAAARAGVTNAAARFCCLGPGGGGQMYGVGISPHDPNLLHVSCDMGTFYVSADGGRCWSMVDEIEMTGTTATRPAYHPTDPDTLFMPYARNRLKQLRVSHDRGRHWQVLCDDAPWGDVDGRDTYEKGVTSIDLDPWDGTRVFVSAPTGLFRSADGGRHFARCEGVPAPAIGAFVSPLGTPSDAAVVAAAADGVYLSADGGATWRRGGAGLSTGLWSFAAAVDRPSGRTHVYAASATRVFRSEDGGETFQPAALAPGPHTGAYRFLALAPTNARTVYVSSLGAQSGVWRSSDAGATWTQVYDRRDPGIRWGWIGLDLGTGFGGRANRITVDPGNPDRVAYVNTAEFFLTEDGGRTWRECCSDCRGPDPAHPRKGDDWSGHGLEVALPTDMVWDPFVTGRAYLVYGDLCFLVSTNRGQSWRSSLRGIPETWHNRMWELVADPAQEGVLYAACCGQHGSVHDVATLRHDGGVVISRDHGDSWAPLGRGLPRQGVPCTSVALDARSPTNARTLFCVMQNDGVYRSTDGGTQWVRRSDGLGHPQNHNVEQVRLGPDGAVYALVIGRSSNWKFNYDPGGLWRSADGGDNWTEATRGLRLAYPKEFAVDPRDARHIYVATTQAPACEPAGLWETRDGGDTWRQILSARELGRDLYAYVHSGPVSFHPTRPELVYYATKTHGLWFSRDGGATWRRLLGLPRLGEHRVVADPADPETIYVTSVGIWQGPAEGY